MMSGPSHLPFSCAQPGRGVAPCRPSNGAGVPSLLKRAATASGQFALCLCSAVVLFTGCQKDETGLGTLSPLTGEVFFEGAPAVGAVVDFVPEEDPDPDEIIRTFALVGEDGRFSATTVVPEGAKPGAVPGNYAIRISWKKRLDPDDRDSSFGPELLPAKYQDVKTSGLQYEVTPGSNEIPPLKLTP
jgi:hypothetical protein